MTLSVQGLKIRGANITKDKQLLCHQLEPSNVDKEAYFDIFKVKNKIK